MIGSGSFSNFGLPFTKSQKLSKSLVLASRRTNKFSQETDTILSLDCRNFNFRTLIMDEWTNDYHCKIEQKINQLKLHVSAFYFVKLKIFWALDIVD